MNSEINPNDLLEAEELFEDAEEALEQHDTAAAEKILRTVVEKNPNFSFAYRLLAEIVAANTRYPEAIRILDLCLKNDSGYSYASYLSAKYRFRSGDTDTAARFLSKARSLDPHSRLYALAEKQLKEFREKKA
jgi:tetratricopeptide (TPR) repeat protein